MDFPGVSVVKNLPANARDSNLIAGSGRSLREINGKPLQYAFLGNAGQRGAQWLRTVHEVTKESDTN